MSINRVRIEAEGPTMDSVLDDLNQAFGLLYGSRYIPRESEFVEEVVESHIRNDGAIEYRGRRVIKYFDDNLGEHAKLADGDGDQPAPASEMPVSWVVSGSATTAAAPLATTVWNAANAAAAGSNITPVGTWEIRDACGTNLITHYTVAQASTDHPQPWYFQPTPGTGG